MFRPNESIGRFLMSTPSRLVGEFECSGILVTHVFPNLLNKTQLQSQFSENLYSRSYYVISTAVEKSKESTGKIEPKFAPDMIVDLASVWFGKRFDFHGWIENLGTFWMPYGTELSPTRMSHLGAYNHKPRKDLEISLNLKQLSSPFELLLLNEPQSKLGAFWKAASFYARALRAYENDSEVAFLHLITAIEIIASVLDFPENELYDAQSLADLKAIEEDVPKGKSVAKRVRAYMLQLSKKVNLAASELTNDTFFAGSESGHKEFALTKVNLGAAVQAAYDVRSSYVHSGVRFSMWLDPLVMQNEIQIGKPVLPVSEKELAKSLSKIPTFLGLERLVRYMILRFAHLNIKCIHACLD